MKNFISLLFIGIVSIYFFSSFFNKPRREIVLEKLISISFVGDLMCHTPQYESARTGANQFDFKPVFREVKSFLSKADFTIGNLETVIGGEELRYSSYPLFNTPEHYLDALKDAGFDILITSNNHSLDRGIIGVVRTIDQIRKHGMRNVGTYKTVEDRDSIVHFEKDGIKIAILAYTYGLNGNYISEKKNFVVNLIDTNSIKTDIGKARQNKMDIILVYFHFGEEYQRHQNSYQRSIIKQTIKFGADAIISSHPHVIQSVEFFKPMNKNIDTGFVAYSLGNFISNQRWRYSDCGVILNFRYQRTDSNKISLSSITSIPTWVYKGTVNGNRKFVILPSDTNTYKGFIDYLSTADRFKIFQSYLDAKNKMGRLEEYKSQISSHKN